VRTFWERYGSGSPRLLLLPRWSIIHSRCWKAQIPYLARHYRRGTRGGFDLGRRLTSVVGVLLIAWGLVVAAHPGWLPGILGGVAS
jgi:hypothetical protein